MSRLTIRCSCIPWGSSGGPWTHPRWRIPWWRLPWWTSGHPVDYRTCVSSNNPWVRCRGRWPPVSRWRRSSISPFFSSLFPHSTLSIPFDWSKHTPALAIDQIPYLYQRMKSACSREKFTPRGYISNKIREIHDRRHGRVRFATRTVFPSRQFVRRRVIETLRDDVPLIGKVHDNSRRRKLASCDLRA